MGRGQTFLFFLFIFSLFIRLLLLLSRVFILSLYSYFVYSFGGSFVLTAGVFFPVAWVKIIPLAVEEIMDSTRSSGQLLSEQNRDDRLKKEYKSGINWRRDQKAARKEDQDRWVGFQSLWTNLLYPWQNKTCIGSFYFVKQSSDFDQSLISYRSSKGAVDCTVYRAVSRCNVTHAWFSSENTRSMSKYIWSSSHCVDCFTYFHLLFVMYKTDAKRNGEPRFTPVLKTSGVSMYPWNQTFFLPEVNRYID